MSDPESLPEKARAIGAVPLRWMGRQAVERLSMGFLVRNNRYDQHLRELRRALSRIETHHAEHHLLRRFISELPRTFTQPWTEQGQVEAIDTLEVRAGVRHDNIRLLTRCLLGEELTDKDVVNRSMQAEKLASKHIESVCSSAVAKGKDYAWVDQGSDAAYNTKTQAYITPTTINGIVMSFTGPAIRGTDSPSSEYEITFYSVPPAQ